MKDYVPTNAPFKISWYWLNGTIVERIACKPPNKEGTTNSS